MQIDLSKSKSLFLDKLDFFYRFGSRFGLFNVFNYEITYFIFILSYVFWHKYSYSPICFTPYEEGFVNYQGFTSFFRPLDDLMQGKVFHKDYYFWYGPLYLLAMAPIYILLDGELAAQCVINNLYFPALALLMSYVYIRLLVKSPFLRILFVLVCIFHVANSAYPAPRHLAAELALAFFIFSLSKPKPVFQVITGVLAGIGVLTSYEYGLPAAFFIFVGYVSLSYFQHKTFNILGAVRYSLGLVIVVSPFILYLVYHDVLIELFSGYSLWLKGIAGGSNPSRGEYFPPLPEVLLIKNIFSAPASEIGDALVSTAFRFYLPLITYAIALVLSIKWFISGNMVSAVKILILTLYGIVVYYRIFSGPGYGSLAYGLVPAITLGFLFLNYIADRAKYFYAQWGCQGSYNIRTLMSFSVYSCVFMFCVIWNVKAIQDKSMFSFKHTLVKVPGVPDDSEYVNYNRMGYKISKYSYDQFSAVNDFIEQNTKPTDKLLVYPWGPYNLLTGRPSPFRNHDAAYGFFIIPSVKARGIERLKKLKLKYIVLNTSFGNLGIVHFGTVRGDTPHQISWLTEEGPIFASNDDPMHIYILENYHLVKRVDPYAMIMERNEKRIPFNREFSEVAAFPEDFKKVDVKGARVLAEYKRFGVDSRKVRIEFHLNKPILASHVQMEYLFHAGLIKKTFTKSQMTIGVVKVDGVSESFFGSLNDLGDMRKPKSGLLAISIPIKKYMKKIKYFWIEIDTRDPYFLPEYFQVNSFKVLYDKRLEIVPGGV